MGNWGFVEWFSIAGSALAIVALPSVFQMIWGAPHLEFDFGATKEGEKGTLRCTVYNYPIENWFLRKVGVRRESATVYAAYKIHGSEFSTEVISPILTNYQGNSRQVEIAAGPVGAAMGIIFINGDKAYIVEDPRFKNLPDAPVSPINAGTYLIQILVFCGEKNFKKSAEFVITKNAADSYWVN